MVTKPHDYYYPASHDLGEITARPHESSDDGHTMVIVALGGRAGTIWLSDPAKARELLAAAFAAVKILDPAGADDALSSLLDESALEKIRQRIKAEDAVLTAAHAFVRPGQVAPDRPAPDRCMVCGDPEAAHAAASHDEPASCSDCGAADTPLDEAGVCWNRGLCRDRVTAQAGAR